MRVVSRFEAELLRILEGVLNRAPLEHVFDLPPAPLPDPIRLSRAALDLIADRLEKGIPGLLMRCGGWFPARHLEEGRIAEGRLWDRVPASNRELNFTGHALDLLITLARRDSFANSDSNADPSHKVLKIDGPPTLGDRILFFFAYRRLRDSSLRFALRQRPEFADPLFRLTFPEDVVERTSSATPDFRYWLCEERLWFLEVLQPMLAARWVAVERRKRRIRDPAEMQAIGNAQDSILGTFLEQIAAAGRRDLARFLLHAATALLSSGQEPWFHLPDLDSASALDRSKTFGATLTFLRHLQTWEQWVSAARNVGYLDDGYQESQLLKSDWEHWEGANLCRRARDVMQTCHNRSSSHAFALES